VLALPPCSLRSPKSDRLLELNRWYSVYLRALDQFRPDLVFFFGCRPTEWLIPDEAHRRSIPVAAYVANAAYPEDNRWSRHVDLILTNSRANADAYAEHVGYCMTPLGLFVDPSRVVAPTHEPKRILFINPTLDKGGAIVLALAAVLARRRPDIEFEIVESRGRWETLVSAVRIPGVSSDAPLPNVVVTPNAADMRPIYQRARVLLAPSLVWESAGRVLVEAMLNGIPTIVSDHGGMPEMIQDGGVKLRFPSECHEPPYTTIPPRHCSNSWPTS
jgi:glycosyltransferase involved in cell wall biosynthesis